MNIISVDYRLGPENPFPIPVQDAVTAWNYVLEHPGLFGLEINDAGNVRIPGIGGDSAGAYLAAIIGLGDVIPDLPLPPAQKPAFQLLVYPMMDLRGQDESWDRFDSDLLLTRQVMGYFARHFLGGTTAEAPLASLILQENLSASPKTWLMTVEYDPLRDAGRGYAAALEAAGVDIDHVHLSDCMHGFLSAAGVSTRAHDAVGMVCDALALLNRENQKAPGAG